MYRLFALISIFTLLVASNTIAADQDANLSAVVLPGALEIDPLSLSKVFTPVNGLTFEASAQRQKNAIHFIVDDITINDLNGDGMGWALLAIPKPLTKDNSRLPIGKIDGFFNPSDPQNTKIIGKLFARYTGADQTSGYTIDFGVHYTIPALAESGTYTGEVALIIRAD